MKTIHLEPGDDLAAVLLANRGAGTVINLSPGEYPMPGNWQAGESNRWCHVDAGVTVRGVDPIRRSVLAFGRVQRETGGKERPDRDLTMLWCNGYPEKYRGSLDTTLENLVIDLRGRPSGWYSSGLRMHNRSVLRNIRILGVRGAQGDETTLSKDVEAFAVSATGNTGGSRWSGLACEQAEGYASGFFLGSTEEDEVMWSRVVDCVCELPEAGWFGFAANQRTGFDRCQNIGGRVGFYNDWLKTVDIHMSDCDLVGGLAAILVRPRSKECRFDVRFFDGSLRGATAVGVDVGDGVPVEGTIVVHSSVIDADNLYIVRNTGAELRFEFCSVRRRVIDGVRHGGNPPKVTGCYGYERLMSTVK